MSWISSLAGNVTSFTATLIVAVAVHVPFVMHALLSLPVVPPPVTKAVIHSVATTTKPAQNKITYPPPVPPLASSTEMIIPLVANFQFLEATTSSGILPLHSGGKGTISFVPDREASGATGNIASDVYVNGIKLPFPVSTNIESNVGYSPDGTYYGFREVEHGGCCDAYASVQIFNLLNGQVYYIGSPPSEERSQYASTTLAVVQYEIEPFIESYAWINNHAIDFIFYFVSYAAQARISPRELWEYDFTTGNYTLLQTLNS